MKVRVYTDYEPVRILRGVSGKDFMEPTDALALKSGLSGTFVEVEDSDIPSERADRDCWVVEDGKVKVNAQKKLAKDLKKSEKESNKNAVFSKLKITKNELLELLS